MFSDFVGWDGWVMMVGRGWASPYFDSFTQHQNQAGMLILANRCYIPRCKACEHVWRVQTPIGGLKWVKVPPV
jgi:hypothetical protein